MNWKFWQRGEQRGAGPVELAKSSSPNLLSVFGLDGLTVTGEPVTINGALGVPAVSAAVNFLARSPASLPVAIYEKTDEGRKKVDDHPAAALLNNAAADDISAFQWRFEQMFSVVTTGRHVTFIERDKRSGEPVNLWPLPMDKVRIERSGGKVVYRYREGRSVYRYESSDVIDMAFYPSADRLAITSPIMVNRDTIALAISVTKYAGRFFSNGGVPPFAVTGPFESVGGMTRAAEDLRSAFEDAAQQGKSAVAVPDGHAIKELGFDPEKMQMIDTQRFLVEQIARIFSLPPVFLQDLTHGTFSNTEQQDLHLVKHTLSAWIKQFEQEINLKLFGRKQREVYAEVTMAGLLRGDLQTRMEAMARAIQTGQLTPNEARALENRAALPGGDDLFMQGATVPIGAASSEGKADE